MDSSVKSDTEQDRSKRESLPKDTVQNSVRLSILTLLGVVILIGIWFIMPKPRGQNTEFKIDKYLLFK